MSDYDRRITKKYENPTQTTPTKTETEKYFEFAEKTMTEMLEISKRKNADYTGGGGDPFANFTRVEAMGICTTEQGFLTRMTDKMCRISSFVQNGTLEVKDESVQDTLKDLANYSILMLGYLEAKRDKR